LKKQVLSEVGPYAILEVSRSSHIPESISKQPHNELSNEEILSTLHAILQKHHVTLMDKDELQVNLSKFTFCSDLGSMANNYGFPHTVDYLLFLFTD